MVFNYYNAVRCKNCESSNYVRSGYAKGKQRYRCKSCGYLFVEGDARTPKYYEIKKSISVMLYAIGKSSYGFIAKLFGVSRTTAYNWIKRASSEIEYPEITNEIQEIDLFSPRELWYIL